MQKPTDQNHSIETVIIGFTGHRSLSNPDLVAKKIEDVVSEIVKAYPQDTKFAAVSSAAAGSDILFCETALRVGLPLMLYLPFAEEIFEDDFKGDMNLWWPRAKSIIEKCKKQGSLALTDSQFSKNEAYLACGRSCAETSTVLVAVAEADKEYSKVGTHAIIKHAKGIERPVIIIDPELDNVILDTVESVTPIEKLSELARFSPPCGSKFQFHEKPHTKLADRVIIKSANGIARCFRLIIQGIQFVFIRQKKNRESVTDRVNLRENTKHSQETKDLYHHFDSLALDITAFRDCATVIFLLEALGIITIAAGLILHPSPPWLLPAFKVVLSSGIILLFIRLMLGHHSTDLRVRAEAFRAAYAQMATGCPFLPKPLDRMGSRDITLKHALVGLRLNDLWESTPVDPFKNIRQVSDRYEILRIEDQYQYFDSKSKSAVPWAKFLTRGYRFALFSVLAISAVYLYINFAGPSKHIEDEHSHASMPVHAPIPIEKQILYYLLPITFASLGTFFIAALSVQELGRREDRFRDAAKEMKHQGSRIRSVETTSEMIEVMNETEQYLADEVYSWRRYSLVTNRH